MSIALATPAAPGERPLQVPRILAFYVPLALNAVLMTLVGRAAVAPWRAALPPPPIAEAIEAGARRAA